MRITRAALSAVFCLLIAACASTPQASVERDAQAKEFNAHPGTAALYIYRTDNHYDEESVLYIDGRLIGSTLPGTYFRVELRPGKHKLHGIGADAGGLTIEGRPGEILFVSLQVSGGNSHFERASEAAGRQTIEACCALLENWAPGQRPLLR